MLCKSSPYQITQMTSTATGQTQESASNAPIIFTQSSILSQTTKTYVEVKGIESRNSLSIDMFLVFGMIGVLFLVLVSFVVIYLRTKSKFIIC